ncbi:hypothetical protein [Mycoplasma phocimorsus]|uniref:Uncharacterized protein n=1 Tax=Mycoplasma phocimorsus TaxID=3045839 RepID=A0AAJ1PSJ6_9MOLU|nr:hypothetical protein [Mycoplasma phocimorsus]MDJ1645761.1 hypothetical protein [Mycoplasma phocimorsus]MDJ1646685.1 hypothetical protein [Mycoplasma phocimorsus]MDJ1647266.1 hypothetical protein [Mycoplasma phocimorsus]
MNNQTKIEVKKWLFFTIIALISLIVILTTFNAIIFLINNSYNKKYLDSYMQQYWVSYFAANNIEEKILKQYGENFNSQFQNMKDLFQFKDLIERLKASALSDLRVKTITQLGMSMMIWISISGYLYYGFVKAGIGYVFTTFMTVIFILQLVGTWVIGNPSLATQIITTIVTILLLGITFYIYLLLNQNKFYQKNKTRWV